MAYKGQPKTPGSGRKRKGTARETARRSADIVTAWRDAGMPAPLQVMLSAMEEELSDPENIRNNRQNRRAFPYASACAVYFHPKAPTQVGIGLTDPEQTARDISAALREMDACTRGGSR